MREIARKLDLTTTETFRQLHRLNEALLVKKEPDGNYTVTEYGWFVLQFSSSFEFIYKHRQFFSTHALRRLPDQFLYRIGDLCQAELRTDMMANINTAERITREAEQFMWGGGAEQPLDIGPAVQANLPKGVKYRWLFKEKYMPKEPLLPEISRFVEWRSFEALPVNIVLTEKEAGISFSLISGQVDYVAFVSKDPRFLNWVKELFLFYWEKGKRV